MKAHVESLMVEMEKEAKARVTPRMCGGSVRKIEGVEWYVTTGGSAILWKRDGKRISRKKAAIQIGELLQ